MLLAEILNATNSGTHTNTLTVHDDDLPSIELEVVSNPPTPTISENGPTSVEIRAVSGVAVGYPTLVTLSFSHFLPAFSCLFSRLAISAGSL